MSFFSWKPFSDRETRLSGQIQAMASILFSPTWNQELFGQQSVERDDRNIQVHRVKSNGHLDLLVKDASAMQKTVSVSSLFPIIPRLVELVGLVDKK